MKKIAIINKLKQFLACAPLISKPLAKLYFALNKECKEQNKFYSDFIGQGDLVFDVGACYGKKLVSFLKADANVVAIEPQEKCVDYLRRVFGADKVTFIQKALGDKEAVLDFYEGQDRSFSTASKEWMADLSRNFGEINHVWKPARKITATTLDKLVEKYGIPHFIKIDVEGFEFNVLKGLSRPVNMIAIEFIRANIPRAVKCIDYLNNMGPYSYNLTAGENYEFKFGIWKKHNEIVEYLMSKEVPVWGDIYIKSDSFVLPREELK